MVNIEHPKDLQCNRTNKVKLLLKCFGTLPVLKLWRLNLMIVIVRAQSCPTLCHSAYKSDTIPSSPTRVPVSLATTGGVLTLRAAYIPDTTWSWEFIRFMKIESKAEPIVIQIYHGKPGLLGKVSMYAEDNKGPYSYTRYSETGVFPGLQEDIVIQISDLHVDEDDAYRVYLGKPGNASSIRYNYRNYRSGAWDELSYMRFNTTREIKTDNKAIYFKSVTVCSDDVPVLCGAAEDEVVPAVEGNSVNLTCSGSGAPDLEPVWISNNNETLGPTITEVGTIPELLITAEEINNTAADQLVTSTVVMKPFKATYHGIWRCYFRNKNLDTNSTVKTFYVPEIIAKPVKIHYNKRNETPNNEVESENETDNKIAALRNISPTSAKHPVFKWVISQDQSDVLLECHQISPQLYTIPPQFNISYNSTNFQHSATLTLPEEGITADSINCSLYLVLKGGDKGGDTTPQKLGVVIRTTLYRVGYRCSEGEYGEGEECLKCPDNKTSNPGSSGSAECFTPSYTPTDDSSPANKTFLIGVAALLVLIFVIVAVYIIARKYCSCKKGKEILIRSYDYFQLKVKPHV